MLSRLIDEHQPPNEDVIVASVKIEKAIFQIIKTNLQHSPINFEMLLDAYSKDPALQQTIKHVSTHWSTFNQLSGPELKKILQSS